MIPLADLSLPPLNFDKWYSVQYINGFAPPPPFISASPPSFQNIHFCPPLNKILNTVLTCINFLYFHIYSKQMHINLSTCLITDINQTASYELVQYLLYIGSYAPITLSSDGSTNIHTIRCYGGYFILCVCMCVCVCEWECECVCVWVRVCVCVCVCVWVV